MKHYDGDGAVFAGGALQFTLQSLLQVAAVEETGEGIADGLIAQGAQAEIGERERHLFSNGGTHAAGFG
jgi:hypothetical protein